MAWEKGKGILSLLVKECGDGIEGEVGDVRV